MLSVASQIRWLVEGWEGRKLKPNLTTELADFAVSLVLLSELELSLNFLDFLTSLQKCTKFVGLFA